jgi:long-chain acyl-CoA synthetase
MHELLSTKEVKEVIQKEVDICNLKLGKTDQIQKFILLDAEWTVDSGELTPTLKLKRKIILNKNKAEIEALYGVPA